MEEQTIFEMNEKVKISDEVIAVITGIAACEIKGVAGMSGSSLSTWTEMLSGKKNNAKGVRVDRADNSVKITLQLIVKYGVNIPEVCAEVQEAVKNAVEEMTGLDVTAVDVNVDSLSFEEDKKTEKTEALQEDKE